MIPPQTTGAPCPRCGSPWFAQQEFRQYADLYSSRVGGSLSPLSGDPQYALVCLCGMLIQPKGHYPHGYYPRGYRLSPEEQSFLDSWKRAQEYQLRQSEAEERTQRHLRAAVNLEHIQQLSARLDSDEKLIDHLAAELKGRHLKPRRNPGR